MAHLFISHSNRDGAGQALALAHALEALGHRCWIAPRDVKPAVPYPGQIVAAIEEGVGLVLLVTPGANESPDVLQEVQVASSARKPIAPVIVASAAPSPDLRYYIGVRHQIAWAEAAATAQALMATFVLSPSPSGEGAGGGVKRDISVRGSNPRFIPGTVWRDAIPGLRESACPEMVTIQPGQFLMGAPEGEEGSCDAERPQHEIRIDYAFAVSKYETTVDEFTAFFAATKHDAGSARIWNGEKWQDTLGDWRNPGFFQTGRHPVCGVNWNDAKAYVAWLNAMLGLVDRADAYRLPSEAEWEYACRAGTTSPFSFGATILAAQANYKGNYTYGTGPRGEYRQKTMPVGSFSANPFGLHDMHGNVWEWCADAWHANYNDAPSDGSEWLTRNSSIRVLRGGSWDTMPQDIRSASRFKCDPTIRFIDFGFRVARSAPGY